MTTESPELETAPAPAQADRPDLLLRSVVESVDLRDEPAGRGTPISLVVQGALISGWIIPHWQWFHELDGTVEVPEADRTDEQRRAKETPTLYIHLKAARILLGGGTRAPLDGSLMRVRLADVGAWSFDVLAGSDNDPLR